MYGWGATLDYMAQTNAQGWDSGYPVAGVDYDPALLGPSQGPPVDGNSSTHLSYWDQFVQAGVTPQGWVSGSGSPLAAAAPQSLTAWLNANAGKVAIGAGALVGLMLLAKAGR